MPRSGLQQDVINLYRQGMRTVMSKPKAARQDFLLHLRYNFHHPPLKRRDYTAIEHRLRIFSRTLEMIGEPSVQRISVGSAVEDWWDNELAHFHAVKRDQGGDRGTGSGFEKDETQEITEEGNPDVTQRGDSSRAADQWGGTLPGHGGT